MCRKLNIFLGAQSPTYAHTSLRMCGHRIRECVRAMSGCRPASTHVTPLNGCIADVDNLEDFSPETLQGAIGESGCILIFLSKGVPHLMPMAG